MESVIERAPAIDLSAIDSKLDRIQEQMGWIAQRQRYQSELIDEMWPILNEVVKASTETMNDLEKKGYFAFAREGAQIFEKIVENYSEEDVRQLGESIVGILDTVKNVTQPEVLAVANEATGALSDSPRIQSKSLFGMLKATRDADVKYGMAVVLEVLRHVGRSGRRMAAKASSSDLRRQRLKNKLQPSGRMAQPRTAPASRRPASTPDAARKAACAKPAREEIDVSQWSREIAQQVADAEGLTLTGAHWKIIEFAREHFLTKGASPNIRLITSALAITTKDIYQLFPKAPARTVSRIAGIPKPAGCI